jgi:hypothetical protein
MVEGHRIQSQAHSPADIRPSVIHAGDGFNARSDTQTRRKVMRQAL